MRRISFALLALLPVAAAAQRTAGPTAAEQSLIETNAGLSRALAAGDTSALAPLLAGDLVYTDASGAAQSRAQLLSSVAAGYRVQASVPEVTRVHIDGNLGLLDFQTKIAGAGSDSIAVQSSAVYVLRAGHWQLASLHSTGAPVPSRRASPPPPPAMTLPAIPTPAPMTLPPVTRAPSMAPRTSARASGTFTVETKPLTPYNTLPAAGVGRLSIDKQYHGDIEGTGKGEMLTAGTAASGSAGYVAVEYVSATVGGRKGTFALQHFGTMDKGALSLTIAVVPGSGTGALAGISGTMNIIMENGKHSYQFDYSLPASQ